MMKKWTRYMLLMLVLLAQALGSCSLIDEDLSENTQETNNVTLAFDVSVLRSGTRMSDAVTQQANTPYRGISKLYLFPYDVEGVIGPDKTSLTGNVFSPYQINEAQHYYMDDKTLDFRIGTASFLCYAKAEPSNVSSNSKFVNGSMVATIPDGKPNTSSISFAPEVIHESVTVEEGDEASKIATYLTDIAKAIPEANRDFFLQFINSGHPVACSSTNVEKLEDWVNGWATANEVTLTLPAHPDDIAGYPENLPDGAAVVAWNETTNKFEPQTVTTTEVNINSLDRFVYPAELWYYANSRIKTSTKNQKDNYNLTKWSDVLAKYETDNGVMDVNVRSVAIKEPLSYAVGCLQIGLVLGETLKDAGEPSKTITLSESKAASGETPAKSGTFPLTAVIVSGQREQAFDFTAKNTDNNELIIYDNQIPAGISMGDAIAEYPTTDTPEKYVNTLVFQTKDGENVRFALEFENNSGEDFTGCDGTVFAGTKFYLVGDIKVPTGQTNDWLKRVFTKSYTTQGTVRISSLKQAYTYLPDLLDPRLEIGIKLVPNWMLSTPTNVPL
jgi:hypothetical protein